MKCSVCKRETSEEEEFCPRCGTAAKRRMLPVVLAVCCALIAAALVVGAVTVITRLIVKRVEPPQAPVETMIPAVVAPAAGILEPPPPPLPTYANDPATCLEFISPKGFYDLSSSNVTGSLKNNCERSFRYVHIRFKIFDADHNQVGTAAGDVSHLQAGGTYQFLAHGVVTGTRFELDQVTGL
jgi:hypothetical protein